MLVACTLMSSNEKTGVWAKRQGGGGGVDDDSCFACMQKQAENDAVYQTLWQLHVEKIWCLRHLVTTKEGFDECVALEVHVAEELERMYGGLARRMYAKNARAYLQLLLKGVSSRAAAEDAASNLALILHELNPRALSLGNLRASFAREMEFVYDPTRQNFIAARSAVMQRGSMLAHMHAFYL